MSETATQPKALTELAQKISAKQKELQEHLGKHKTEDGYKMNQEQREQAQALNNELNDLGKKYDDEKAIYVIEADNQKRQEWLNTPINALPHQTDSGTPASKGKTPGQLFVESAEFKGFNPQQKSGSMNLELDVDMKTLLTTSSGMPVQTPVATEIIATPRRRLVIADLIPQSSISGPIATWMEQTTDTNNAGVTAEGATKNESAAAWTKRTSSAKKITDSIPITTEELEDVPGMQQFINQFLNGNIMFAEEGELLNGDGTGEHLLGFTQLPNILTYDRTSGTDTNGDTDNNVDAIFRMFTLIRSTGSGTVYAEPSGVVMHPTNWEKVRLMKTLDGAYLWGPPSESGETRVWGKSVVITPALTVNTALTGDFAMYSRLRRYKTIRFEVGYVNDQFIKNEKTFLAEERIILQVIFQKAFGLITNLN